MKNPVVSFARLPRRLGRSPPPQHDASFMNNKRFYQRVSFSILKVES